MSESKFTFVGCCICDQRKNKDFVVVVVTGTICAWEKSYLFIRKERNPSSGAKRSVYVVIQLRLSSHWGSELHDFHVAITAWKSHNLALPWMGNAVFTFTVHIVSFFPSQVCEEGEGQWYCCWLSGCQTLRRAVKNAECVPNIDFPNSMKRKFWQAQPS